jgi:hypothetical protein
MKVSEGGGRKEVALKLEMSWSFDSCRQSTEQVVDERVAFTSVHFLCLPRPLTFHEITEISLIIGNQKGNKA